jgi:hypothetical protein
MAHPALARHAFQIHSTPTTKAASAVAAICPVQSPSTQPANPAAESPLTKVTAIGIEQHATHAPAKPTAAKIGFFIVFLE